jgi:recombination protein RecT
MNRQDNLPALLDMVDKRAPSFRKLLPPSIPVDRFISATKTALLTVPGLVNCEPQSVILACMRCAADGLVPDGRKAVLVVGRSKRGNQWVDIAQYWQMAQGLQDIVFRTGKVIRLESRTVHANDVFDLTYGSEARISHKPRLADRGKLLGAYAIATFKGGEDQLIEWMEVDEIDSIMRRSKSWNKEKNEPTGPWKTDYSEMARKTVMRRIIKYLPQEVVSKDMDEGEDEAATVIEGEFTRGPESWRSEGPVPGGTATSGERIEHAPRPAEEPHTGDEVAAAEQEVVEGGVVMPPAQPAETVGAAPGPDPWKQRLRELRDRLKTAPDADSVEVEWMDWDSSFTNVPTEVTTRAKQLVHERIAAIKAA